MPTHANHATRATRAPSAHLLSTSVLAARWRAISPELPTLDRLIPWLDAFWERRVLELLAPVGDLPALFDHFIVRGLRLGVATKVAWQGC